MTITITGLLTPFEFLFHPNENGGTKDGKEDRQTNTEESAVNTSKCGVNHDLSLTKSFYRSSVREGIVIIFGILKGRITFLVFVMSLVTIALDRFLYPVLWHRWFTNRFPRINL
jgi:hypothetical protein